MFDYRTHLVWSDQGISQFYGTIVISPSNYDRSKIALNFSNSLHSFHFGLNLIILFVLICFGVKETFIGYFTI